MDNPQVPRSSSWKEEARSWLALWKEHLIRFQQALPPGRSEVAASAQELLDRLETLDEQVEGSPGPAPGMLLDMTDTVSAVAVFLGGQLDGPAG